MIREAQRFGNLTVLADAPRKAGVRYVLTVCDCGTPSIKQWSNIAYTGSGTKTCGNHGRWGKTRRIGAPLTYFGWHKYLWRTRGQASDFDCVDCSEQASDWSYAGGCEDEYEGERHGSVLAYCTHEEHYHPRCKPCHAAYDEAARNA
jgi:hypothetical protein